MTPHQTPEGASRADSPLADPAFRERLRPLPPSAKLLARCLAEDPGLTQGDLAERSLLPPRTVRYGLNRLEDANLATARPSLQDARHQVYVLQA